jgi:hypothetical protein
LLQAFEEHWDWSGPSSSALLPWSASLLAQHAEHWDWERISANSHISWTQEMIAPYTETLNWATLSAQAGLPWDYALYLHFDGHWFASLVGQHHGLNVHHLSSDDIATLLLEKPSPAAANTA